MFKLGMALLERKKKQPEFMEMTKEHVTFGFNVLNWNLNAFLLCYVNLFCQSPPWFFFSFCRWSLNLQPVYIVWMGHDWLEILIILNYRRIFSEKPTRVLGYVVLGWPLFLKFGFSRVLPPEFVTSGAKPAHAKFQLFRIIFNGVTKASKFLRVPSRTHTFPKQ